IAGRSSFPLRARFAKKLPVVRRFRAGKSCDDGALKFLLLPLRHRVEAGASGSDAPRSVIEFGTRTFEEEQVVRRKIYGIKAQRIACARQAPIQIGPGPVDERHEVIADDWHACLGNCGERILPCAYVLAIGPGAELDGIVNRDAFGDGPNEACGLDFRFTLEDFVERPSFAAINVMQGGNDARRARLFDLIERNRVLGAEPRQVSFMAVSY